jgi:hypothetical protein
MVRARPIDDRLEVRPHLLDGNAAKSVVDPERENQDVDFLCSKRLHHRVGGGVERRARRGRRSAES